MARDESFCTSRSQINLFIFFFFSFLLFKRSIIRFVRRTLGLTHPLNVKWIGLESWLANILYILRRVHEKNIIIGDPSERHWRPRCLIGDKRAKSKTDMPHRRPICLIGDRHASSKTDMPHRRSTCLIGDPSKTDMLYQACPWVSDQACRSPMGNGSWIGLRQ